MTYRFPIHVGDRVAIAPHHDLWMAGCRFGTVTSIGGEGTLVGRFYFLDLDTGRNITLAESDLLGAVGPYNQPDASPSIRTGAVERGECTECIVGRPETACRQPLDHEGPHDFDVQHEMTLCRHEDCGYGECSWLWGGGEGMCDTHRNNKGRCQIDQRLEEKHSDGYGRVDPMDSYWSGTGESMGDDSYIDYLNRS